MSQTKQARVCVPVCVRRADELRPSFARAAEFADIVELRLDCLEEEQFQTALSQLPALLGETQLPFIITYRPREQGGGRDLSLGNRVSFWRELPERLRGVTERSRAFVDVELDLLESDAGHIARRTLPKLQGHLFTPRLSRDARRPRRPFRADDVHVRGNPEGRDARRTPLRTASKSCACASAGGARGARLSPSRWARRAC